MSSSDVVIPGVFTASQREALRTWWKKVTATYPKASSFKTMQVPVVGKGVFGVPLAESIQYAHATISYIDDRTSKQCFGRIPIVVAKCGSFLKEEALTVKGIFRLCGNVKRIGLLQSIFDAPDQGYGVRLDWRGYTTYDAAGVLRRFLTCLPEPVITHDLYESFRETIKKPFPTEDAKIEAFQCLIESLPLPNQYLLLYLLDLLGLFALHKESTLMDIPSLAVIFTPGVLCHPRDNMDPASYKESQFVIQFLVENQARFAMPQARQVQHPAQTQPNKNDDDITQQAKDKADCTIPAPRKEQSKPICDLSSFSTIVPCEEPLHVPTVRLRRSRTAPSRRRKYGEHEPPQVVHVNRYASQGASAHSKWRERCMNKQQQQHQVAE